jgi:predicted phosphodiesterase
VKIGIFSDLHLEFESWMYDFKHDIDLYINAGDTHPNKIVRGFIPSQIKVPYFEILGNHDFYGSKFPGVGDTWNKMEVGGKIITGATLWTAANPIQFIDYQNDMMDCLKIKGVTEHSYNLTHITDLQYIEKIKPDIVVTHHSPSMRSCSDKFKNSHLNIFFHNKLDYLVEELQPELWVHGHTHEEMDYKIGRTRVICHPRGYPHENKGDYKPKYVEI